MKFIWNPMKSYGILWKPYGILWNPMKSYGIHWDPMRSCEVLCNPVESHRNPMKSYETLWNHMQSIWNPMESYENLPDLIKSCGILWNHMKSYEILWNHMNLMKTLYDTVKIICKSYGILIAPDRFCIISYHRHLKIYCSSAFFIFLSRFWIDSSIFCKISIPGSWTIVCATSMLWSDAAIFFLISSGCQIKYKLYYKKLRYI